MQYEFNGIKYAVMKDFNNVFNYDEVKELITSYFNIYDYILGDYSYNKVRLKGFCDSKNKNFNKINDIEGLDNYIENYCSYGCNWFLLRKMQ